MKLDFKRMLTEIDDLTNSDFCADMEMKLLPKSKSYTQAEARKMANIIANVYSISHCLHCKACAKKYKI